MSNEDHHPSALRNRGPILEALLQVPLPPGAAHALEIASGTGAHMETYAPAFPHLTWQPTEYCGYGAADQGRIGNTAESALVIIDRYCREKHPNVLPALHLNAADPFEQWPEEVQSKAGLHALVMCSNVTHISPWEVTLGLVAGAAQALAPGGSLVLYGPFKVNGEFTTESNREFDASLRQRNPLWGYRDVSDVEAVARRHNLILRENKPMPANNQLLWFSKVSGPS
eukprot:GGOE01042935.1.p1 GENE.GGOE01042935.1~~GGOE01042935.1.p1  ORF type:complete len:234 (+),score=39.11 GGOE01042935.1:22-702(+)